MYVNYDEIAEIVQTELFKVENEKLTTNDSFFGILAQENEAYAIPVNNIIRAILLPTEQLDSEINISGEKFSCLLLFNNTTSIHNRTMHQQTFCLICQNSCGIKTIIPIGDIWDCPRFFIKSMSHEDISSLNLELNKPVSNGIVLNPGNEVNGYQLNYLIFE